MALKQLREAAQTRMNQTTEPREERATEADQEETGLQIDRTRWGTERWGRSDGYEPPWRPRAIEPFHDVATRAASAADVTQIKRPPNRGAEIYGDSGYTGAAHRVVRRGASWQIDVKRVEVTREST